MVKLLCSYILKFDDALCFISVEYIVYDPKQVSDLHNWEGNVQRVWSLSL